MEDSEELIGYARRENEEYRRLEREHRELDEQIQQYFGNVNTSPRSKKSKRKPSKRRN